MTQQTHSPAVVTHDDVATEHRTPLRQLIERRPGILRPQTGQPAPATSLPEESADEI
ncbi:hypothetical protein QCD58_005192 [Enterobacter hormaechei]|nr:hypothetical protein [Enterobacter hormaechei]EKS6646225.1 hypothetical protein [Enterobacter hormaechei]